MLTACGPVKINLGAVSAGASGEVETGLYVVKEGDTLSGIAEAYRTSVEKLIDLNAERYPRLADSGGRIIVPGWELVVPANGLSGPFQGEPGQDGAHTPAPSVDQPGEGAAPAVDTQDGYFDYDAALEIVRLTNEERSRNGLASLTVDDALMTLAQSRSVALQDDFSHNGFQASSCGACGENIAGWYAGQTAEGFVGQWIGSPGHHDNMLASHYTAIGAAVFRSSDHDIAYAVQILR